LCICLYQPSFCLFSCLQSDSCAQSLLLELCWLSHGVRLTHFCHHLSALFTSNSFLSYALPFT
jgi:hypothetical protein